MNETELLVGAVPLAWDTAFSIGPRELSSTFRLRSQNFGFHSAGSVLGIRRTKVTVPPVTIHMDQSVVRYAPT